MDRKPFSGGKKDKRCPVSNANQEQYYTQTPHWSFRLLDDTYHKWQFDDVKDIFKELKAYEGMTWQEIMSASGGKRKGNGSNSHYIQISDICKEAQDRLSDLKLDDNDVIFSLRIGSRKRIWGLLRSRTFEVIWYDPEHEIYGN